MKAKVLTLIFAMLLPMLAGAVTANDAMAKASAKLTAAKSVTAKFSGSVTGTLTVSGSKFAMTTNGFGIWYNGRDMWTYSQQAGETSLTTPTQAELLEANPLEVVKSYRNSFNAAKVSEAGGKITLKLTPKAKSNPVKAATLVLNTKTWMPVSIDMTMSNNQHMLINITSITEGSTPAAGTFEYPKAKYPNIEVVDLR